MSTTSRADISWSPQPQAQTVLDQVFERAVGACGGAKAYADKLLAQTGVRWADLLDSVHFAATNAIDAFRAMGWARGDDGAWRNPEGRFPPLLVEGEEDILWVRVESVAQFVSANALGAAIKGEPFGPVRRAIVFKGSGVAIGVIERNGYGGFDTPTADAAEIRLARLHLQAFKARRREFDTVEQGLDHTEALVKAAVADLGPHRACEMWLKAERDFWMTRCAAGRLQKARQDALGIGWANIDHHTYDGSRRHFRRMVGILETLGYELREMLYAGELAGWGSQVLWQPVIGSTVFADLDLAPEELQLDFAHDALPDLQRHRRAGLLSALLGESILEAGLNHVAGLFDWRSLQSQLGGHGVRMMAPFSTEPHLYQELTLGDWDAVDPRRVDTLEGEGHIDAAEAEKLRLEGSIVTHFENIERNAGYKGFNREGIDGVLRKLDPRAYHASDALAS